MLSLFAHHAEAFFKVEINGRDYPDGMTEHVVFGAVAVAVLVFMGYGVYAGVRDFRRWRRTSVPVKA